MVLRYALIDQLTLSFLVVAVSESIEWAYVRVQQWNMKHMFEALLSHKSQIFYYYEWKNKTWNHSRE